MKSSTSNLIGSLQVEISDENLIFNRYAFQRIWSAFGADKWHSEHCGSDGGTPFVVGDGIFDCHFHRRGARGESD